MVRTTRLRLKTLKVECMAGGESQSLWFFPDRRGCQLESDACTASPLLGLLSAGPADTDTWAACTDVLFSAKSESTGGHPGRSRLMHPSILLNEGCPPLLPITGNAFSSLALSLPPLGGQYCRITAEWLITLRQTAELKTESGQCNEPFNWQGMNVLI